MIANKQIEWKEKLINNIIYKRFSLNINRYFWF